MKKIFASGSRRKTITLVAALTLILALAIGGTVAWLTDSTTSVVNTFTPGKVTCEVVEEFNNENSVKTSVKIKNTGNVPAYIRVAVVGNTMDGSNVTGAYDVSDNLDTTQWFPGEDGFYYYNGIVPAGDTTSDLIATAIPLPDGKQVTILASAIQSTPDEAVNDAWGMNYADGIWSEN